MAMNNGEREQQIKEAARQRADQYVHLSKWSDTYYGFIDGAKWADSHPQWIPVEEELPPKFGRYMFLLASGDMVYEVYYPDLKLVENVTHWMPMPVPPQRKEAKNEQD